VKRRAQPGLFGDPALLKRAGAVGVFEPELDEFEGVTTCYDCRAEGKGRTDQLKALGWLYLTRRTNWVDRQGLLHEKGAQEVYCPRCWMGDDAAFMRKVNKAMRSTFTIEDLL
jgi:hypothetical protein